MIVGIIGAGPSGLVAAKTLIEHNYKVIIFEKNNSIGGTFYNKTYDDGKLVSSNIA